MNKIYSSLKKGHKINIGQDIADRVRTFVFNAGWDKFDDEVVENIKERVMNNYFIIINLQENDYLAEDIEALDQLITDKIHIAFDKFKNQQPTPKQIYYYFHLVQEASEEHKQLMSNYEIHNEITRLVKLKEQREIEMIEDIKQNEQAYNKMQAEGVV